MTETVELIQYLKLPNQKLMNLIKKKTAVLNLMTAITINIILTLKTKKEHMKILIKVAIHTQDAAYVLIIFNNLNIIFEYLGVQSETSLIMAIRNKMKINNMI